MTCNESLESTEISCIDTGYGISEEDLKNIFNPFFTTKPPGEGTGLGLFIAYTEMEKFGGKIEVSSEIGRGSEFKMVLPKEGAGNNGEQQ